MVATDLLKSADVSGRFHATDVTRGNQFAWATQGLVIYVRGSLVPVWPQLIALWGMVSESQAMEPFRHARLWNESEWRQIPDSEAEARLRSEIQATRSARSSWKVELLSDRLLPQSSLEFHDVGHVLGQERASYVRLRFPLDTDPNKLQRIAEFIVDSIPFWHGSAGYIFNVVENERELAYDQVWAWARRYWGVQVMDPVSAAWDAPNGLLGINWLTLLGHDFLAERLPEMDAMVKTFPYLTVDTRSHGAILKAGEAPLLGDMNSFAEISPYIHASHLVAPAFVSEATDFPGMFKDHKSSLKWIHRFENPSSWLDPEVDS